MNNKVTLNIRGLYCDNPRCNYGDSSIPFVEFKEYIGSLCPECGRSLLTKEDCLLADEIVKHASAIENMISEKFPNSDGEAVKLNFKVNSGKNSELTIERGFIDNMKIGDKFKLTDDAVENYGSQYKGLELTVSHVAKNIEEHPGYDEGLKGMALYDAEELNFSVYEYEVIQLK